MDLLLKQRESVANHIRLENEHHWAEVNSTLVQDDRAFFDFVPVGQFKGAEGVRELYHVIGTAFPDLHIEVTAEHDLPGCSIREISTFGLPTIFRLLTSPFQASVR
jgi:hypothetical protein